MEYEKIKNDKGKNIYVSVDREAIRTIFDTGVTKAELQYHDGVPAGDNILYEVKVELSREFIDDTYHLASPLTEARKIKACLELGERAYQEKGETLRNFEIVRGVKADSRLRYIPRINMTPGGV